MRSIEEGILFTLLVGLISKKRPAYRVFAFCLIVLFEIVTVVLLYSGQEESSFFFWHPYIVLMIVNLADYATYKRGFSAGRLPGLGLSAPALEKFVLWPLLVVPVLSGFVLTTGWLIKLYGRYLVRAFQMGA